MPRVSNVLTVLAIAVVLTWAPVLILVFGDWGWAPKERLGMIVGFGITSLVMLVIVIIMATMRGEPLFSPQERVFGSETEPMTKSEAAALFAEHEEEVLEEASQ